LYYNKYFLLSGQKEVPYEKQRIIVYAIGFGDYIAGGRFLPSVEAIIPESGNAPVDIPIGILTLLQAGDRLGLS
jgi:hypothetical protein